MNDWAAIYMPSPARRLPPVEARKFALFSRWLKALADTKGADRIAVRIGKGLTLALETSVWDIQDHITTKERQLGYLQAALDDGDPGVVAAALGNIAEARGMAIVAKATNVTREGLYKALSSKGDPRLSTLFEVTKALGLRLNVSRAVQGKRGSGRRIKATEKVAASSCATPRRRSA